MKFELLTKIFKAFFISILITSRVFAQSGFQEGYVVTNENDSIFGFINIFPNKQNIQYCILQKNDERINYYPDMMQRFGFKDGACYASNVLRDTILQVLVHGKLNLYRLQSIFYIQKEGEKLERLASFTKKVISNGEMHYVEDIRWKGTLAYLTSDCETVQKELQKLRLIDVDMTEFVVNYNKCVKVDYIEYGSTKPWTKVAFGISGGYNKSIMHVENSNNQYFYTNQTNSSIDPSIGLIFNFTYPRITEKFLNQVEINYSKTSYFSSELYSYSSIDENYEIYMDFTVLSIPISFNYLLFKNEKMSFFLQGGGDIDFFLKSYTNVVKKQISGDQIINTTESDPYDFKNYHAGLFGGIGYQKNFNKFSTGISLKYFYIINSTYRPQFNIDTQKIALSLIISVN